MTSSRSLLTAAALGAALVTPSAAHAAEGFTGVTTAGQVAVFQSDSLPGVKSLVAVSCLGAGEQVVGLAPGPDGALLAITSAGTLATLDPATGKATMKYD